VKICKNGHLTGTLRCGLCGSKAIKDLVVRGDGRVRVARHERPRDENGRNALDELRRSTRVGGRAKGQGAGAVHTFGPRP
jgi:hypothetical protein